MKTYNTPSTSKLVARFDNELKKLLMEDLKVFKERNQFYNANNQAAQKQQLKAAWSIIYILSSTSYEKNRASRIFGTLYFFVAYFTMSTAVLADAPGVPIFSSNRS